MASSSFCKSAKQKIPAICLMEIFFSVKNLYFVGNPREAHSIVCESLLKLAFYQKQAMAYAGACAKENGLMWIYIRAHVNQFTNLYLRRSAPCHFERSHWRRVVGKVSRRQMRCACQLTCGRKIERTKKSGGPRVGECNDDGHRTAAILSTAPMRRMVVRA